MSPGLERGCSLKKSKRVEGDNRVPLPPLPSWKMWGPVTSFPRSFRCVNVMNVPNIPHLHSIESFFREMVSTTTSSTFGVEEINRAFSPQVLDHGSPDRWPGLV